MTDGISIKRGENDESNYGCYALISNNSRLFNPSIIRQGANRLRMPYKDFVVVIKESEDDEKTPFYDISKSVLSEVKRASSACELISR